MAAGIMLSGLPTASLSAAEHLVSSQQEYRALLPGLSPGDTVVLANGTWEDFEILFEGQGTEAEPITLTAQDKGQVILSGISSLKLAGEHLVVSGLVFRDGYAPGEAVIAFRKNAQSLASHSRVTETVIDAFNKPVRNEADYWVAIYGQHNRFDHNHLEGKGNKGVTVAVRLDTESSRENHHRIDHNYFGPRPVLGGNGGETLRIGTSHFSLSNSLTVVENNYFYKTNGEHEIISNKSGGNVYRGNVFYESLGTLTMRHGHDTLVEENVFIGNGLPHTGGIRVINRRQTVRNNYLENLTDNRFRGALVIMNGIPDAPLNRYDPVEHAVVENNTVINAGHIALGAGSSDEINAVPTDTRFSRNLIYNQSGDDIFDIYDDITGITFEGNILNDVQSPSISQGFSVRQVEVARAGNGLLYPVDESLADVGVPRDLSPVSRDQVGVPWYEKREPQAGLSSGEVLPVSPGQGVLHAAVSAAGAGDIIELQAGRYVAERILVIDKPLTFRGTGDVRVEFERPNLFEIVDGGSLSLENLHISGASAPDYKGNAVIRTASKPMLKNYQLRVENCEVTDLVVNRFFNFLSASPESLADRIDIIGSRFSNITGTILKLDPDRTPYGSYSAEYVTIEDSQFENIQGALVNLFSEAGESVFGPHFRMVDSTISDVGVSGRDPAGHSVMLHGVPYTDIGNNQFEASAAIRVNHLVGMPDTRVVGNTFRSTPAPVVEERYYDREHTAIIRDNVFQ